MANLHKKQVTLTETEANHILTLISFNERDGTYWGNKAAYWRRSQKIKENIENTFGFKPEEKS